MYNDPFDYSIINFKNFSKHLIALTSTSKSEFNNVQCRVLFLFKQCIYTYFIPVYLSCDGICNSFKIRFYCHVSHLEVNSW